MGSDIPLLLRSLRYNNFLLKRSCTTQSMKLRLQLKHEDSHDSQPFIEARLINLVGTSTFLRYHLNCRYYIVQS